MNSGPLSPGLLFLLIPPSLATSGSWAHLLHPQGSSVLPGQVCSELPRLCQAHPRDFRTSQLASQALRPLGCRKTDGLVKMCVCSHRTRENHTSTLIKKKKIQKKKNLCHSNNHFLAGGTAGHMPAKWLAGERAYLHRALQIPFPS